MTTNVISFAVARRTSRANLVLGWGAAAKLRLYTASRPAGPDTAISTQTLLAEFTLPNPAGSVASGVFTADAVTSVLATATGTAAWARLLDASNAVIADLDCGATGSGAAIELNNLAISTGGEVVLTAMTITEG